MRLWKETDPKELVNFVINFYETLDSLRLVVNDLQLAFQTMRETEPQRFLIDETGDYRLTIGPYPGDLPDIIQDRLESGRLLLKSLKEFNNKYVNNYGGTRIYLKALNTAFDIMKLDARPYMKGEVIILVKKKQQQLLTQSMYMLRKTLSGY